MKFPYEFVEKHRLWIFPLTIPLTLLLYSGIIYLIRENFGRVTAAFFIVGSLMLFIAYLRKFLCDN